MSFGGAVKLTGESEYRKALSNIKQSLREVSAQMKLTSTEYDKNDKSSKALAAQSNVLGNQLKLQQDKVKNLENQYKSMNNQYSVNAQKHSSLVQAYNKEKAQLDLLGKTVGTTSKEYQEQKSKVEDLAKQVTKSTNAQDQNAKAMSNMRIEIANAQSDVNKTTKAIDELGKETEETGKQAKEASNDGFTVLKGALADLSSKAISSAINGLKKLGGSVLSVGKQAVESYAHYEQLVGGVETLFKDSADIVQKYADRAYKTAGISANMYMEQATSFSASLLQGLGGDTKRAAEIADMAIIDMSDNANKMGTNISMIQNAYQGFAKDNFTMLDNLKLGYGGTAGEMARLINETGVMGKAFKATANNVKDVPFDKMIEAIHEVQVQMGITGTTSLEAADTIEGSAGSMKASWQNLLTAIADENQDLGKKVDEFVNSVVTASKNLVPRVKQVVEGIKKLVMSIVNEVFPKLKKEIPELAPLIDTFDWFIKNKSLVVGAMSAMVGAFAVNKILTFSKGMSDVAKRILEVAKGTTIATTATNINTGAEAANTAGKVAATGATGALTAATNLLNAAWKANPIGIVVAGVSALIGVFGFLKSKTDEATKAQREQSEAIQEAAEKAEEASKAYDDLRETQQKQVNVGMTEINHYQSLYDELQNIVDQNGKVKKGYEERASFITSTLSEALGIEIKNVNGVIKGYGKLKDTIDEVMEKKKAQILLDSQETLYKEAINGQINALRELNNAESELNQRKEDRQTLVDELSAKEEAYELARQSGNSLILDGYLKEKKAAEEKLQLYDEETAKVQTTYDTQKELLSKFAYDIGIYESNMAAAHAGEYEKMSNVNWEYVKDYQKAGDAEKAQLEDQVTLTETNLNLLKELKEKSGKDIYDQQIKDAEKQLTEHKKALKQYESATKTGLDASKIQWENGLDKILSEITGSNIEFKEDGKGNVTMYADGIKAGESKPKEEMAKVITDTIKEVTKKDKDAKTAGEDLIDGVNNGIANEKKQSGVFTTIKTFGGKLLSKLRASLKEHSPSKATKEMGQFLLEGLGLGIDKEENNLLNQISGVGRNIVSTLQDELNAPLALSDIQANVNASSVNSNGIDSYLNVVEAFKEALSQMTIELDDENMAKFIDKTVTRTIYS